MVQAIANFCSSPETLNIMGRIGVCPVWEKINRIRGIVISGLKNELRELCSQCLITEFMQVARELWPCPSCSGEGIFLNGVHQAEEFDCEDCHGLGIDKSAFWKECSHHVADVRVGKQVTPIIFDTNCPNCQGTGQIPKEPWEVIEKMESLEGCLRETAYPHAKTDMLYYKAKFSLLMEQKVGLWDYLRRVYI